MKQKYKSKEEIQAATTTATPNLCWEHNECGADHADHEELRWPDVGLEVTVAHRRERHHHEVKTLEQIDVFHSRALEVLESANAANHRVQIVRFAESVTKNGMKKGEKLNIPWCLFFLGTHQRSF